MKLILELRYVPLGTAVTKPTGEKPYTVKDRLKIYNAGKHELPHEIIAQSGTKLLVAENGDAFATSDLDNVTIHGGTDALRAFLKDLSYNEEIHQ